MTEPGDWGLAGKIIIVTGASRGIGAALAGRLASMGAVPVLCARTREALQPVASAIIRRGGECRAEACDVADPEQVARFVNLVAGEFGHVDGLVNNAGVLGTRVPLAEYDTAQWVRVFAANLHGVFFMTRAVAPVMLRQGVGSIVNVTSGVGNQIRRNWGAYGVSKWALEGFSLALAGELRGSGVRVNLVNPGGTRTAMRAAAYPEEDPETLPEPEAILDVFLYLLSDRSAAVLGQRLDARGWVAPVG